MATGGDMDFTNQTKVIEVNEDKCMYIDTTHKKVMAKMYDFRCDIKLKAQDLTFRAHKGVLADASDYFAAMFHHNMLERDKDVIELKGISPLGFQAMMDYFYHGHINIESATVEHVLEAARFFHIEWLIHVSQKFLIERLSIRNYDAVLEMADRFFLGDLQEDIFKFLAYNFGQVTAKPSFLEASYELLHDLLSEDYYIEAAEARIFKVLWRWLAHRPEERGHLATAMLTLIRFPLLEPKDLDVIPDDVLGIPEVRECIDEARHYHNNPGMQCLLEAEQTVVRGSRECAILYSVLDDANLMQFKIPGVEDFYSVKADTSFMQSVFEFASVAVLGNFLFVVGGYDRKSWCSSNVVYRYNPRNRLWAQLSSMKQPRVSFSLCASQRGLYAVTGIEHVMMEGHDRELILHNVEFYDPMENLWRFIPELPFGCFSAAACTVDEKLYVSGGISDDPEDTIPVRYLHVYNPDEQLWTPKAPMLSEHQGHGMIEYDQRIYVFGGYTVGEDAVTFTDSHKSEVYDIKTNQWSKIIETPSEYGHFHGSLTKINHEIFIIGGSHSLRTLHVFDANEDRFTSAEICGHDVQKIVTLKLALPLDAI